MPDFFLTNEQFLLAKWDYLLSVFHIVARDSRRREDLTPELDTGTDDRRDPFDNHRGVLRQTVSDLIEVEAALTRMGQDSPADTLNSRWRGLWQQAVAWVREERRWRFPHARLPDDQAKADVNRRVTAERAFFAAVAAHWSDATGGRAPSPADEPTADQPVTVAEKCAPGVSEVSYQVSATPVACRG